MHRYRRDRFPSIRHRQGILSRPFLQFGIDASQPLVLSLSAMVPEYTEKLLDTMSSRPTGAPNEHKEILVSAFTALVQGDFNAFREALAPDVEFTVSGFEPMAGTWRVTRGSGCCCQG